MHLRRTVLAAVLAAGVVVPAVSTATAAFAHSPAHSVSSDKKPTRTVFAATGRITAVDASAGTVTLLAKGGTKDVRKRSVTISVGPDARVVVNEKRGTLETVTVGARISVTGTRVDGVYTATRVRVSQRATPVVTPTPDPTPTPTPTPGDDDSGDDD